jgi:hypothetical protein
MGSGPDLIVGVNVMALCRLASFSSTRSAASILAVAWFAGASMACGGGGGTDSRAGEQMPTAPSRQTIPSATIQLDANGALKDCVGSTVRLRCDFEETGKNLGPGCATNVHGTVSFMAGETLVGTEIWSLQRRVLQPDETFVYRGNIARTPEMIASITGYNRRVQWENTPC